MKTTINATFVGSYKDVRRMPADNRAQIAFAGRSNVGKSSLLNKLTGRKKLAKVSNTPGKTRSLNFYLVNDKLERFAELTKEYSETGDDKE